MRAVKMIGVVLLLAAIHTGCADLKAIFSPPPPAPAQAPTSSPPAPAPPVRKAPPPPPPPPPVLSPEVGREDEERQKREAGGKIQKAEETIRQVDQKKLSKEQQETFSTIQSFVGKAKEALTAQDFPRASNLADKAKVLAEDLVRGLR